MRLAEIRVQGFRCLDDIRVEIDDLTVLIGPNSAGKSSLLRALKFFFEGDPITHEDVYCSEAGRVILVRATFENLSAEDRAAFGPYATGNQMVLTRTWDSGSQKLSGRSLRFPPFAEVRSKAGREFTAAYRALREARPELGLDPATNIATVEEAMLKHEMDHPNQCVTDESDAGSFFGFKSVGETKLAQRFRFVFVPGLRDAADEAVERRGTILEQLLSAIASQRAEVGAQLSGLEQEMRQRYQELLSGEHADALDGLAIQLERQMRRYVPAAKVAIEATEPAVQFPTPGVVLRAGEAAHLTDIGRQGHGLQRTFILAALEYLASSGNGEEDGASRPRLMLAIEEPELYQHPPRARHFFHTLCALSDNGDAQTVYATHSPYFVAADRYAALRIFRREPRARVTIEVSRADEATIATSMGEDEGTIRRRLSRTMSTMFCEAFFSHGVVLVEGPTDAAAVIETARLMDIDLIARGVTCTYVTKSVIPLAMAILTVLHIPIYVMFDGHKGGGNENEAKTVNRRILAALGQAEVDFPITMITERYACLETDLEGYLGESIPAFSALVQEKARAGGWKPKSAEKLHGRA